MLKRKPPVATAMDADIGARIRNARRVRGFSQSKLGDAVGITFQQVQKYEKGHNRVSVTRLCQIAEILDVPLSHFVEEAIAPKRRNTPAPYVATPSVLLKTADALKLLAAFDKIKNPSVRRRCVQLVQSLAADQDDND